MSEKDSGYAPSKYISKERIYALMGIVLAGSVAISSLIMYVGQAIFYPLNEGIRLEGRIARMSERYDDLRDAQKQILNTLRDNTNALIGLRKEMEMQNRFKDRPSPNRRRSEVDPNDP